MVLLCPAKSTQKSLNSTSLTLPAGNTVQATWQDPLHATPGYVEDWELKGGWLYLRRLVGYYKLRNERELLIADWFSGWVVVGYGQIEKIYPGQLIYLSSTAFRFENGRLNRERLWQYDSSNDFPARLQWAEFFRSLEAET